MMTEKREDNRFIFTDDGIFDKVLMKMYPRALNEKQQFTIVGEEYVGYTQGNAYIISNGECKFSLWESKEDAQKVCDYLNEQQATIEQQEQSITILKQEIADTQAILEMLSEKLKGWNNE